MFQRNDLVVRVTIKLEGLVLDLEGFQIVFKVDEKIIKTIGDGITVTDQANGEIEIEITSEDSNIAVGAYTTELLVKDITTKRYTTSTGRMNVIKSIIEEVSS